MSQNVKPVFVLTTVVLLLAFIPPGISADRTAKIPILNEDSYCVRGKTNRFAACKVFRTADTFIFGRILSKRAGGAPVLETRDGYQPVDDITACSSVLPEVIVSVEVHRSSGVLQGETVDFRIPATHPLNSALTIHQDGEQVMHSLDGFDSLAVGTVFGAFLVDTSMGYSLGRLPVFSVEESGEVVFSHSLLPCADRPSLMLEDFLAASEKCRSTGNTQRVREIVEADPLFGKSLCRELYFGCRSNDDCEGGLSCFNNECVIPGEN